MALFSDPITEVVMPDECQSMPITAPKLWNQKGLLMRLKKPFVPYSARIASVIARPSLAMRSYSHCGTYPLCRGRSAKPLRFITQSYRLQGFCRFQSVHHICKNLC